MRSIDFCDDPGQCSFKRTVFLGYMHFFSLKRKYLFETNKFKANQKCTLMDAKIRSGSGITTPVALDLLKQVSMNLRSQTKRQKDIEIPIPTLRNFLTENNYIKKRAIDCNKESDFPEEKIYKFFWNILQAVD